MERAKRSYDSYSFIWHMHLLIVLGLIHFLEQFTWLVSTWLCLSEHFPWLIASLVKVEPFFPAFKFPPTAFYSLSLQKGCFMVEDPAVQSLSADINRTGSHCSCVLNKHDGGIFWPVWRCCSLRLVAGFRNCISETKIFFLIRTSEHPTDICSPNVPPVH